MTSPLTEVFLFMILPLVLLYAGLIVWSCNRDRWR
jgi:hypothetical protein